MDGLPPAFFVAAELDPLLDDTLFMEARWRAAGNVAELHVFPESPHAFTLLPTVLTEVWRRKTHDWIRARVAAKVCGQ